MSALCGAFNRSTQGQSAESLLIAGSRAGTDKPICFIQIGTASGANITLPGAILRSTAIELKGSGLGSAPVNRIARGIESIRRSSCSLEFFRARIVPHDLIDGASPSGCTLPLRSNKKRETVLRLDRQSRPKLANRCVKARDDKSGRW
jgi:hypothetical protein